MSELGIEHVAVGRLKLDPRNPRLHSERQLKQIARSIQAFGFNVPVLADRDGKLIAGHGRVEAGPPLGAARDPGNPARTPDRGPGPRLQHRG